jgi:hypothetical protein
MCGGFASNFGWKNPGYMHSAVLLGLAPSQVYFYRYGSSQSGWSPVYFQQLSFVHYYRNSISHLLLLLEAMYSFLLMGVRILYFKNFNLKDMGKTENDGSQEHWSFEPMALSTTDNMITKLASTDLALHIGDISYAVGFSSQVFT